MSFSRQRFKLFQSLMQLAPIWKCQNKYQFVIKMKKFRHKMREIDDNFEQD
jgi:hypothetical protein